jgi:uncharacterized repeat protein (TIGR03803 family)
MTTYPRIFGRTVTNKRTLSKKTRRLSFLAALAILMSSLCAAQATSYYTLYSFKGNPDGAEPQAGVVIDKEGALYGTTYIGGTSVSGTVFKLTPTGKIPWKESLLHTFSGPDGQYPVASLVFSSNGTLYGTTRGGPTSAGTIFELAPPSVEGDAWTETVLYTFDLEAGNNSPDGAVLIGPGGTLYTTAQGSGPGGRVDALTPPATSGGPWTASVLYSFGGGGNTPLAGLVSEGGALFGTDYVGGDGACNPAGCGMAYELTPPGTKGGGWSETTVHTFSGSPGDGGGSVAALTVGPGGVLYGTTLFGGSGSVCSFSNTLGCGTVFQLTPPSGPGEAWTESVIYSFTGAEGDGAFPAASVVVGKDGALYGTTQVGGSETLGSTCTYGGVMGCGTVFELTPPTTPGGAWTEKVLHSFSGQNGDGATPLAGLALSSTGVLYGTTSAGGTAGKGTVFAVEP